MAMNERVSVIMPSYNTGRMICESIDSVLSQTYQDLELLISDDHSSDDETISILKAYAQKDERVKVFFLDANKGAGVARNNSISHATGRYIAFCDSDDRWLPEKLEKQLAFMKEKDCCLCFSSYYTCNYKGDVIGKVIAPKTLTLSQEKRDNKIGCLTAIYDTAKHGKFYMPTIRKRQDWVLFLSILKKCGKAYAVQEPLAIYRKVPGSISSNKINLIKYNAKVYKEAFGYSNFMAYMYLSVFFFPTYFKKKFQTWLNNHKRTSV
ncbi:MAG: glycosyltransferase family 2 protein [Prevotellaceae bacterium]|nr:glycosyltransferase family 2 protein [Prevotellaceae bacterium]